MGCGASTPAAPTRTAAAFASNLEAFEQLIAAWGKGDFADLSNPAWKTFMTPSFTFDATGAEGLHPVFKEYKGYKSFKEWLDMVASNELSDLVIKFVAGPKSAPNTIIQKLSVKMTNKATGKAMPAPMTDIIVWDFNENHVATSAKIYFGAPEQIAYVLDKDMPAVSPQPTMPVPEGVTSEKALELFGTIYGAWGTGEFNKPETKQEAMDKYWASDFVLDCTAGHLPSQHPGIFRLFHGHKGGDTWVNDVIGQWEMSGLDMTGEGMVASPTEGAVIHRFSSTIKHKATGKSSAPLVDMVEWYFNADGKCTGGKFYWGKPQSVAALYPAAPAVPPAAHAFFDGRPLADKAAALPELMVDDYETAFVGPYTGATTGVTMDKEKMGGAAKSLTASFPDFTFNPTKVTPVQGVDGGWWAKILVTGTFTGEPFTPMPGKLPPIEPTGKGWTIGPEVFTVYTDETGEKLQRITIEPQYKGALNGPPGIYVANGGTLPAP